MAKAKLVRTGKNEGEYWDAVAAQEALEFLADANPELADQMGPRFQEKLKVEFTDRRKKRGSKKSK